MAQGNELRLTADQLPEIEEWDQGETYKVTLTLEQSSTTEEGAATFDIVDAQGKPAEPKDMSEEELPSFRQAASAAAADEGRTEMMEPSYGGQKR